MSGVRRFLSRREKSPRLSPHEKGQHESPPQQPEPEQPEHFARVFVERSGSRRRHGHADRKADAEHEKKTKGIVERLRHYGVTSITEQNVEYALHHVSPQGDPEAAFRLLWLLEDTYAGIVRPCDPGTKLVGAVNKEGVTCYLDALLFGMFVRLGNFEAMLYDSYTNPKQKRLGALLRLWVNMLRSGRLITTDLTGHIQHALADCGWDDAAQDMQQDPSEAFTFITGQLELPMLTLKMDMFHTGKEDPQDDHKFVNERLLEVAILDAPFEGRSVITLEDCLEHYFNNRIEVKRHLENQRRNTMKSGQAPPFSDGVFKAEKESGTHIEVAEVPETPIAASPAIATPVTEAPRTPADRLRPTTGRKRQDSIFSQRKVELVGIDPEELTKMDSATLSQDSPGRKLSTRTEVLMPAWQFFKLLPWYTCNVPTSDAQVAAHFSRQRPILGICLKRYSYTNDGQARRRDDYVDIPLEIAVPNFVSGDEMEGAEANGEQVGGNFRLMLQAVVCHRGVSVHSGHYICLCRSQTTNAQSRRGSATSDEPAGDPWMRFDDLARERITDIDIHEALKQESPYLLFYQVQPIGDDGNSIHDLPSYTEATSRSQSDAAPLEKPYLHEPPASDVALTHAMSDPLPPPARASTEVTDWLPSSERNSTDASSARDTYRGRAGAPVAEGDNKRKSITLDTASTADAGSIRTDPTSNSVPTTPSEEKPANANSGLLSIGKALSGPRKGTKAPSSSSSTKTENGGKPTRSRPSSTERPNRLSLNMTRLTQRMSKGQSTNNLASEYSSAPEIVPSEAVAAELAGQKPAAREHQGVVVAENPRAPASQPPHLAVPKSKKERKKLKAQQGKGGEEDRECVLM